MDDVSLKGPGNSSVVKEETHFEDIAVSDIGNSTSIINNIREGVILLKDLISDLFL